MNVQSTRLTFCIKTCVGRDDRKIYLSTYYVVTSKVLRYLNLIVSIVWMQVPNKTLYYTCHFYFINIQYYKFVQRRKQFINDRHFSCYCDLCPRLNVLRKFCFSRRHLSSVRFSNTMITVEKVCLKRGTDRIFVKEKHGRDTILTHVTDTVLLSTDHVMLYHQLVLDSSVIYVALPRSYPVHSNITA